MLATIEGVRAWAWRLALGVVLAVGSGAVAPGATTEPAIERAPPASPASPEPALSEAPTYAPSWFDIDKRSAPGWYDDELELPRWIVHHSLPRDTIESVAVRYGVSPAKLRRWNGMSPRARLSPRDPKPLKVRAKRLPPARERLVHTAEPGDTWESLGRRYAVFHRHLRAWNRERLGPTIEPGERVLVWTEPMVEDTMRAEGLMSARAAMIPAGAHSIGTPQSGRLVAGVQVPEGPGYWRRYPNSTWGTTYAVRHLVETLDHVHRTSGYRGTLVLGSMSFRHGGKIGHHISHQSGRDIDIRLPTRPHVSANEPVTSKSVDWDAAWALVLAFAHSGAVEVIFLDYGAQRRLYRRARASGASQRLLDEVFQYPRGRAASSGIVRHSDGHEGHIHVRYACGPFEPACGN